MTEKIKNFYIESKAYVDALKVPFKLMVEANKIKGNAFYVFNPFINKFSLRLIIVRLCISFAIILFFPLAPLFSRLNGLWVIGRESNHIFFESSIKSSSIINSHVIQNKNVTIVTMLHSRGVKLSLGFIDYFRYLTAALIFFLTFGRSLWYYPAILQIPDLINFKNFLMLRRPSVIYFTNHYDRWVQIIVEFCVQHNCISILIQHGIEDDSTFNLSKKYQTLNKLICYDQCQAEIFREKIYENIDSVLFYKPIISLISDDKCVQSILFVGHGDTSVILDEIRAIRQLLECTDMFIYLKPHPVVGLTRDYLALKSNRVKIITDKYFFPRVDFLLHSGSTLALEYKTSCPSVKIFLLNDRFALLQDYFANKKI